MSEKVIRLNNTFSNNVKNQKEDPAPKRRHLGFILVVAILLFSLASVSLVRSYESLQRQAKLEQKALKQNQQLVRLTQLKREEIQKLKDPDFILKYARARYNYSESGEKIFDTPDSTVSGGLSK